MSSSRWRQVAAGVIAKTAAACAAEGLDYDATLKRIQAAYPFGPREHHPYKIWLSEVKKWRQSQGKAEPRPANAELERLKAWNAGLPLKGE